MKKILSILLIFIFIFSLTACNEKKEEKNEENNAEKVEGIKTDNENLLNFDLKPEGVIAKSLVFSMKHFSVATIYVFEDRIEIWHTENKKENSKLVETIDFDAKLLKSEIDKLENNPEFIIYEDDVLLEISPEAIIVYNEKLSDGVKVNYTGVHAYEYRENSKQAEKISKLFTNLVFENEDLGVMLKVKDIIE